MHKELPAVEKVGYAIRDWCRAVGVGKSTFYAWPAELRPLTAKVGARRIILEQPAQYLLRIANHTEKPNQPEKASETANAKQGRKQNDYHHLNDISQP